MVSIIIPTYNRAHLINETLKCVLAQSYTNWECIVVDDGSTDNTIAIVDGYIQKDSRIKFYERPVNRIKGASTCRNIGIENSEGQYIQFLDSDDILSADKIEKQLILLEKLSDFSFAFCKWGRFKKSINDDSELFENLEIYQDYKNPIRFLDSLIVSKGYLPIHSFLFTKKLIDKVGFWNESLSLNDDGEFFSRIITNFDFAVFSPNGRAWYRVSEDKNSLSSFYNENKVLSAIRSWEMIFKLYSSKFKGAEKKYRIYIKRGVYRNVKIFTPSLLSHSFFVELKFYMLKDWIFLFLSNFLRFK